ncbi:MAG TPA: hypothetical protein VLD59_01035 [Steroidobacteraceae bacterium]|nr:hypothetical protein [Steroidobacteraceae bacterium]
MRGLALVAIALLVGPLHARAEEPATPAAAPAAAPATPAASTTATTPAAAPKGQSTQAATPAAANAAATPAAAAAKTAGEYKPPPGYHKEKRDGVVVYCRKETEKGSRFQQKVCFTREDLEFLTARNKAANDELQRAIRVCSSPGTCANP